MLKEDKVKTWLITGCSSGLGRQLAEAVAARGDRLVATARSIDTLQTLCDRYPGHGSRHFARRHPDR